MNRSDIERRRQAAAGRIGTWSAPPSSSSAGLVVVIGPPAAGKSTYVADHAEAGDLVIDADRIADAITPPIELTLGDHPPPIDRPSHITAAANTLRRLALTAIPEAAAIAATTAWLIHTMPTSAELEDYRAAGARIVIVDPGEDIVTARARRLRPPSTAAAIAQWYAAPPAPHRDDIVVED